MKLLNILTGMVLMATLAGCASQPEASGPNLGRLGLQPGSPDVDISGYDAPENAGAFELQGRLEVPDRDKVVFRYRLPGDNDRRLDISLYPLPPGWHDLSGERIVSGHYGQVRQGYADRATRRGAVLRVMQQRLRTDVAGNQTVAEGVLLEENGSRGRLIILEIAALPEVFVRLTAGAPESVGQEHLQDARAVLEHFLRFQAERGHVRSAEQPAE